MKPPRKKDAGARNANALNALPPRDARAVEQARARRDDSPGQAAQILERVVRRNPESSAAWRELTLALVEPYGHARCRTALAQWEVLDPEDPMIPLVKACLAFSETDYAEALKFAAKALEGLPGNFQMLWAKAQCERFLHLPGHIASLEAARSADAEAFAEHMRHERALEKYAPVEVQVAFERVIQIGVLAGEGDTVRARRLLEASEGDVPPNPAWDRFKENSVRRIEAAERRRGALPPRSKAVVRPIRGGSRGRKGRRR